MEVRGMKLFKWRVEAFAICEDGQTIQKDVVVTTKTNDRAELFTTAKATVQKQLTKPFKRITICWFDALGVQTLSKYQQFVELKQENKSKNQISKRLKLPFWQLKEYEDYYNGKGRKLTYPKYQHLIKRMKADDIRKRYGIPRCEFSLFLKRHQDQQRCRKLA